MVNSVSWVCLKKEFIYEQVLVREENTSGTYILQA